MTRGWDIQEIPLWQYWKTQTAYCICIKLGEAGRTDHYANEQLCCHNNSNHIHIRRNCSTLHATLVFCSQIVWGTWILMVSMSILTKVLFSLWVDDGPHIQLTIPMKQTVFLGFKITTHTPSRIWLFYLTRSLCHTQLSNTINPYCCI